MRLAPSVERLYAEVPARTRLTSPSELFGQSRLSKSGDRGHVPPGHLGNPLVTHSESIVDPRRIDDPTCSHILTHAGHS